MTQSYLITMYAPMGERHGKLTLDIVGGAITGTLSILQKQTPVTGELLENGACRLHGELSTLMHTSYYEAAGQIQETGLELTMQIGNRVYAVTGTLADTEEVNHYELYRNGPQL